MVAGFFAILIGLGIYAGRRPSTPESQVAPYHQGLRDAMPTNPSDRQNENGTTPGQSTSPPAQAGLETSGAAAAVAARPDGSAAALQFTNVAPAAVAENVRRAVRQYGDMFGGNPVGTNPEITAAMAGRNPRHINFLDEAAGMRVNGNGELVDPWGTPFFFHQLSATDMEVRSAGPDKTMWTHDDVVVR